MDPQYNYNISTEQGPERTFFSPYEGYAGGEPMTSIGSRSSDGSSGMSSTFSSEPWSHVQIATAPMSMPMSMNSPDEFEGTGSWVMESSFDDSPLEQSYPITTGQEDDKPTFKSLGWTSNHLFALYKFIIPKGQEPYFKLVTGGGITPETPPFIYLDQPAYPQKNTFPCCYPLGCPKKKNKEPFLRSADLERHYKNVHGDPDQKDLRYCDYGNGNCERNGIPFTRKDHYRDHLKDFHKEDIGCAKRGKRMSDKQWEIEQGKWEDDRKIYAKNWRCAHCLRNNQVAEVGWECPTCNRHCEPERQAARDKLRRKSKHESPERGCTMCAITGWPSFIDNGAGSWIPCPSCTTTSWASSGGTSMNYQYG